MKTICLVILLSLCFFIVNAQNRKGVTKELNEYRHFDAGFGFMGPLTDDPTPIGFNLTFGYEVFYPEFEYVSLKPMIGYYYQRYTSRSYKWEDIYGHLYKVVDRVNYKIDHSGFNMGVSANLYLPVESGNIESLFLYNEFNWIKSHVRARFPDQGLPKRSMTTDFYFHYTLKLGMQVSSNNLRFRYAIWVGYSSLNLQRHVKRIIPDAYEVPNIETDITFGFNIKF